MHFMLTINCEACGAPFETYPNELTRKRGQTCSKRCAGKFKHKRPIEMICPTCGKHYWSFIKRKFCSTNCELSNE